MASRRNRKEVLGNTDSGKELGPNIAKILPEILKPISAPKVVLLKIAEEACRITGADSSIIYPYHPDREQFYDLRNVAAFGLRTQLKLRDKRRTTSVSTQVFRKGYLEVSDLKDFDTFKNSRFLQRERIQAFIGIALRIEHQRLGVLFVNFNRPTAFTKSLRRRVKVFADTASLAIRTSRMKKRLEENLETSRVLFEISKKLQALSELDVILSNIAQMCVKQLSIDAVTIYVMDPETNQIRQPIFAGVKHPDKIGGRISTQTVSGKLIIAGKLYLAKDVEKSIMKGHFSDREKIKSAIFLPLKVGTNLVGGMFLNFRKSRIFSRQDLIFFQNFASVASIGILNSLIHGKLDQDLSEKLDELEMLRELDRNILRSSFSSSDLTISLQPVFEKAKEITNAPDGNITWLDPRTKELVVLVPQSQKDMRQRIGVGIVGIVAERKEPLLIGDLSAPEWQKIYLQIVSRRMLSELAVPLLTEDNRLLGVINMEHYDKNAFTNNHLEALRRLANQISLAILNAERNEKLHEMYRSVEAAIEVALKGFEFSNYGHDVQHYTSSIHSDLDVLQHKYSIPKEEPVLIRLKKDIGTLADRAPRISMLSKEEHRCDINKILMDLINDYSERPGVEIQTELHELPECIVSETLMRSALSQIIGNGIEAMQDCEEKKMEVRSSIQGEDIVIEVSDTGCGISDPMREILYRDPLKSTKHPERIGMGSLIVNVCLTKYRGSCEIEPNRPKGTAVKLFFPLEQLQTNLQIYSSR